MQSMLSFKNRRPSNSAIIYFDGSDDEFEESYRQGINAIHQWCYANGKRVTLPRIYGPNLEVFTTPSEGTFYLTLEHKRRHLALSLAGRDLYFMGWRSGHGTFELKPDSQDEHYMREPCVTLHLRKNYSFLSPKREVGNTRIGPRALKDAFEILYKCRGKLSDGLKEAVGILAVHICEAARIQGVLNDVSFSFREFVPSLDSKNKNSFWIDNWDDLAGIAMERVDAVDKGETPPPFRNYDDAPVLITSELQIFRQIRILPRDAYKVCLFKTGDRKFPESEGPLDDDAMEMKSSSRRTRREERQRGKRKASHLEDPSEEGDGKYPANSLLCDWDSGEVKEDQQNDNIRQEKELSDEFSIEDERRETIQQKISDSEEESSVEGRNDMKISGPDNLSICDYLDHFSMVKKMIDTNNNARKENLELPLIPSFTERHVCPAAREPFSSYGIRRPIVNQVTFSAGGTRSDFGKINFDYIVM